MVVNIIAILTLDVYKKSFSKLTIMFVWNPFIIFFPEYTYIHICLYIYTQIPIKILLSNTANDDGLLSCRENAVCWSSAEGKKLKTRKSNDT